MQYDYSAAAQRSCMSPRRRVFFDNPPGLMAGFSVEETVGRRTTRVHFPGRGLSSVQDAAWVLEVHPTTIYRWVEAGELRGVSRDGVLRIPNSDLMEMVRERF